jgi:hypothetical protein
MRAERPQVVAHLGGAAPDNARDRAGIERCRTDSGLGRAGPQHAARQPGTCRSADGYAAINRLPLGQRPPSRAMLVSPPGLVFCSRKRGHFDAGAVSPKRQAGDGRGPGSPSGRLRALARHAQASHALGAPVSVGKATRGHASVARLAAVCTHPERRLGEVSANIARESTLAQRV